MDDEPDMFSIPDEHLTTGHSVKFWDPFSKNSDKYKSFSATTKVRIKRDIMQLFSDPVSGILIYPDDNDLTMVYALITGLFDTPYEGGLFLFVVRFPSQYPSHPPKVRLLTTGQGTVRFNPNWYKCGKVCLSILGTWSGPGWTPAQTLSSVLLSIQSLMNSKPYHNEPGFDQERKPGDSDRYNKCIEHETIRVAVCGMLEGGCSQMPAQMLDFSNGLFLEYYDHYVALCTERLHLDGTELKDPFGCNKGKFHYRKLLERLEKLHSKITKDKASQKDCCSSDEEATQSTSKN